MIEEDWTLLFVVKTVEDFKELFCIDKQLFFRYFCFDGQICFLNIQDQGKLDWK